MGSCLASFEARDDVIVCVCDGSDVPSQRVCVRQVMCLSAILVERHGSVLKKSFLWSLSFSLSIIIFINTSIF